MSVENALFLALSEGGHQFKDNHSAVAHPGDLVFWLFLLAPSQGDLHINSCSISGCGPGVKKEVKPNQPRRSERT